MITLSLGELITAGVVAVVFLIITALLAHSRATDQYEETLDYMHKHFAKEREALETERKTQVDLTIEAGVSAVNQLRKQYDPKTGTEAKKLITRGVRKANKLWRARVAKLTAEHEQLVAQWESSYALMNRMLVAESETVNARSSALHNVVLKKIALPAVRTAFMKAYWDEVQRLRCEIARQKGE